MSDSISSKDFSTRSQAVTNISSLVEQTRAYASELRSIQPFLDKTGLKSVPEAFRTLTLGFFSSRRCLMLAATTTFLAGGVISCDASETSSPNVPQTHREVPAPAPPQGQNSKVAKVDYSQNSEKEKASAQNIIVFKDRFGIRFAAFLDFAPPPPNEKPYMPDYKAGQAHVVTNLGKEEWVDLGSLERVNSFGPQKISLERLNRMVNQYDIEISDDPNEGFTTFQAAQIRAGLAFSKVHLLETGAPADAIEIAGVKIIRSTTPGVSKYINKTNTIELRGLGVSISHEDLHAIFEKRGITMVGTLGLTESLAQANQFETMGEDYRNFQYGDNPSESCATSATNGFTMSDYSYGGGALQLVSRRDQYKPKVPELNYKLNYAGRLPDLTENLRNWVLTLKKNPSKQQVFNWIEQNYGPEMLSNFLKVAPVIKCNNGYDLRRSSP